MAVTSVVREINFSPLYTPEERICRNVSFLLPLAAVPFALSGYDTVVLWLVWAAVAAFLASLAVQFVEWLPGAESHELPVDTHAQALADFLTLRLADTAPEHAWPIEARLDTDGSVTLFNADGNMVYAATADGEIVNHHLDLSANDAGKLLRFAAAMAPDPRRVRLVPYATRPDGILHPVRIAQISLRFHETNFPSGTTRVRIGRPSRHEVARALSRASHGDVPRTDAGSGCADSPTASRRT